MAPENIGAAVVVEIRPEEHELVLRRAAGRCYRQQAVAPRKERAHQAGIRPEVDLLAILLKGEIAQHVDAFVDAAGGVQPRGRRVEIAERVHVGGHSARPGRIDEYRLRDLFVRYELLPGIAAVGRQVHPARAERHVAAV